MIKTNHAIIGFIIPMFVLTWYFSNMIDKHYEELQVLQEQLWECQDDGIGDGTFRTHVTLTMYHPIKGQTDSTPNITADGTKINIWKASDYRYVAVSRDLLSRWGGPLDYGDWIVIEGTGKYDGVYQVRDTMASKFINRVDILLTKGSKHFRFDNITLYRYFKYDNVTLHKHEKP